MGCCGRGAPAGPSSARRVAPAPSQPGDPARPGGLVFEYIGGTGLTVIGAATGRRYRFDRPGARLPIDPADKASLAAVPHLRRVFGGL